MTGSTADLEERVAETVKTVHNAIPRDMLKKHEYELTSEAAERHGATQWTWHRENDADESAGFHRHVSLALLVKVDGSIDSAEFWIGASMGKRIVRRCVFSRPLELYRVDSELEELLDPTIAAANALTPDDLQETRPFEVSDEVR
ncbi:hypothetical protein C6376_17205 [Streptomyces sp. P3]|uniref:hypothetical protein n=1 Tax=Streptomyces sp. P3 TaxID=2135430 RepID=UPI000D1A7D3D|nr:hypothetical protein [Streptomyces sp. P3]AVV42895.1 hypothetical protein C6376_17205 [Streptomyces sp. P3]